MLLKKNIEDLFNKQESKKMALIIGNFDGVHLGHRYLLSLIAKDCEKDNLLMGVMTFSPHPRCIIGQNEGPFLIDGHKDKINHLAEAKVEILIEKKFDQDLLRKNANKFIEEDLFSTDLICRIYVGFDFKFGHKQEGDYHLLKKYCDEKKIECISLDQFKLNSQQISSSIIRDLISKGDISKAREKLGREFFLSGKVVHGMRRGGKIGFSTANLGYEDDRVLPGRGVYITRTLHQGVWYPSITNVGLNPTFADIEKIQIETHIIDFNKPIYNHLITVSFVKKIRNEKKFESVNELILQIRSDLNETKDYFR